MKFTFVWFEVHTPFQSCCFCPLKLNEWKEAIVCPIFKGGRKARQDPTNYRPISLTSCVARTMEKLVNNRMLAYLSENSLLYKHQSGFLPNYSTVLNYATSLTSGKWPLRKESKFIRFSWILVKPLIECLYLAYCSSYRIWVFQTQLTMDVIVFDG